MKKFIVGKTYKTRSACDYECVYSYDVIKRSKKTITLQSRMSGIVRRGVKPDYEGVAEMCLPEGRYSMCPVICAN